MLYTRVGRVYVLINVNVLTILMYVAGYGRNGDG